MGLTMGQRKAVLASQVAAWPKATKAEKTTILDHLVAVNGWHRDHARKMIRSAVAGGGTDRAVGGPRRPREPVLTYSEQAVAALATCWAVLGGPTGKRLQPALADLVPALLAHGELPDDPMVIDQVLAMSAATIDRRLKGHRVGLIAAKGRSLTRPGSLLKSAIALKTWHEWDDTVPGCLEIDLVGHEGGDANGEFHYTLDATDVATGWTEAISISSKGERTVSAALTRLQLRFPFAVLGIHADNGSEFINHHLLKWCTDREITFTRGRPAHSNDQAHVEQKNWTNVRQTVGYHRYDTTRELALLNELWPLHAQLTNLFLPQQKLTSKTRVGAKVIKKYDRAATPATRLTRDHPDLLTATDQKTLNRQLDELNPAALARRIAAVQASLLELARRRGTTQRRAKANAVYLSRKKIKPPTAPRASRDESTTHPTRAS